MTQLEEKKTQKPTDQTVSELEQQRNVLVFLSPSLEVEVRAALRYVEIPLCVVMGLRKGFLTAAGLGAVGSALRWVLVELTLLCSSTMLHPVPADRVQH